VFVDKTLTNYLHCGLIHAALPRAKIVLLRRHPLDSCWAMFKSLFQGQFPFSYEQTEVAEYHLAYRRLTQHWRSVLPPQVFLEVTYEELVREQEITSKRLIDFAGLPWEDAVLRFHENSAASATASAVQVRRRVYDSSLGKWRHYGDRLQPMRDRLARDIPASELT
jgi:hypothetical protein